MYIIFEEPHFHCEESYYFAKTNKCLTYSSTLNITKKKKKFLLHLQVSKTKHNRAP